MGNKERVHSWQNTIKIVVIEIKSSSGKNHILGFYEQTKPIKIQSQRNSEKSRVCQKEKYTIQLPFAVRSRTP